MKKRLKTLWVWFLKDEKRLIAGAIVLLILLVGIRALINHNKNKTTYQTAQVQKGTVVSTVSASGKALTTGVLTISTQVSGVVKQVYVKDGDKVYAGQKLAEISLDCAGQQAYLQTLSSFYSAKSAVASANANYYSLQNAEFVANQKFINDAAERDLATDDPTYIEEYALWKAAEVNFLNNQTQQAQANASLGSASSNLVQVSPTITAPFAGTLSNVELVEGMTVSGSNSTSTTTGSSQRVAVIKGDYNPVINVTLTEIDVPRVKVGQKTTIIFDSITDKTFTGVVATVDRIGTVSSNVTNYGVNIKLDTASNEILPNMAANASIIVETKNDVLTVPSSAIHTSQGVSYVEVMQNGQPTNVNVETGIASDSETEIVSGLTEGQSVVTATISGGSSTKSSSTGSSPFSPFSGGAFRGTGGTTRTNR